MFTRTIKLISLRSSASSSLILSRNFAFKTDLKVKWIRPEKISCIKPEKSGDLASFETPDPTRFLLDFEKSEELKKSNDIVKKMFTLEQNRRKPSYETYLQETVDKVKRHDLDLGSFESKIAKQTAQIRAMQEYMEKFPRNKVVKVCLKELIDYRKKMLKCLRRVDYKRFEWLLEKLDLLYRPSPEEFHWIARKDSLRKLCKIECDGMRQEKLDKFRKHLESQQIGFLEEKIKSLEFIRNEQVECKVPVTVTVEEINAVKKQLAELQVKRAEEEEANKKLSDKEDYELNL